ncbi:uncharacterized protein KZ484_005096 [Pholidichthys leucotaenia]
MGQDASILKNANVTAGGDINLTLTVQRSRRSIPEKTAKGFAIPYEKHQTSPITRIQFSLNDKMAQGLISAGFQKMETDSEVRLIADNLQFWCHRGSSDYDVPIEGIYVSTDPEDGAEKFTSGWEKLGCDLKGKTGGGRIFLLVKREKTTYICDLQANADFKGDQGFFQQGYIRVDEDTNTGAGGSSIFIWYRQTTNTQGAITHLQISTSDEEAESLQSQGYKRVDQDLNQGTGGNQVFLWLKKKDGGKPIQDIMMVTDTAVADVYEKAGAQVIKKNLNTGNNGSPIYLCYYQ